MADNLTLKVTLTGDGRQLSGTLQTATGEVREFGATTEREGGRAEQALEGTGREAQSVSGHLSQMNRVAAVAVTTLLGLVGIRGMASEWRAVVDETEQLERNLLRTQQLIETTGRSANRSARELHQQARELALATLQSTEGVMAAQQTLMTFRGVTGEIFDEAILGATDLAAAMGQDLNNTVRQLGRALEDPIAGLTALTRSGTVFTEGQKAVIREMVETGRVAEAQRMILDELAAQYGGVAAAEAMGLAGAQDTLGQAMQEARLAVGEYLDVGDRLAAFYNGLAERVFAFNEALGAGELDGHIRLLTTAATVAGAAAGAYVAYRGVLVTVTAAQWAFNTAVRANPLGILITVAGAAVGALYSFREELGLTGERAGLTEEQIADLREEMRQMSGEDLGQSLDSLNASLDEATLKAAAAREELAQLRSESRGSGVLGFSGGEVGAEVRGIQAVAEATQKIAEIEDKLGVAREERRRRSEGDVQQLEDMTVTAERYGQEAERTAQRQQAAAQATQQQANALEELRNRLTPGRRETIQLARDMNTLSLAFASGRLQVGEFIALQSALANSMIESQDEVRELAEVTDDTVGEMARAWERAQDDIDRAFADAFAGAFDSFDDFADRLLDGFKRLLAELAYQATLRPIVVAFTRDMGGMMGIPGMGGGTGGGFGQMISAGRQLMSGGLGSISWTGASNQAYSGGWAGSATGGVGQSGLWGGSTANFSGATGLASAGAGFAGSWGSGQVFGEGDGQQWGSTLGALAGTYFGGPIGAAIGSFLGGGLGSLFDSSEKPPQAYYTAGDDINWGTYGSPFGEWGWHVRHTDGEAMDTLGQIGEALTEMDMALAGVMTEEQVSGAIARMAQFNAETGDVLNDLEDMSRARLAAIIDGVTDYTDRLLAENDDIDGLAVAAINVIQLTNALEDFNEQVRQDALASLEAAEDIGRQGGSLVTALATLEILERGVSRLALSFDDTAEGAVHAAYALQEAAGGLDRLGELQSGYYQAVYSETERLSHAQSDLAYALAGMTEQVPTSVSDLRALVEAQDLNTAAGRELALQLMELSPAFAQASEAVERALVEAYQSELGREADADGLAYWIDEVMSGSLSLEQALGLIASSVEAVTGEVADSAANLDQLLAGLRNAINAERDLLRAERDAAVAIHSAQADAARAAAQFAREVHQAEQAAERERYQAAVDGVQVLIDAERNVHAERMAGLNEQRQAISSSLADTRAVVSSLGSALSRLGYGTPDEQRMQRSQAVASLEGMRGGNIDRGSLDDALSAVTQDSQHLFSTWTDWAREQGQTANLVAELEREAGSQLTLEEQQLDTLLQQIETAESHHDRLMGRYDAELAQMAEEHEAVMESLAQQYAQQQAAYDRQVASHRESINQARDHYEHEVSLLDEQLSTMQRQVQYAQGTYQATLSVADAVRSLRGALASQGGDNLPGYADGGIARGPTSGYRVELHGEEAVIPLKNGSVPVALNVPAPMPLPSPGGAPLLDLAELISEVRQMRQEQLAAGRAIADHTSRLSQLIERWERMGTPSNREERV